SVLSALFTRPWRFALPAAAILIVATLVFLFLSTRQAQVAHENQPAPKQQPAPKLTPKPDKGQFVKQTPTPEVKSPVPEPHPNLKHPSPRIPHLKPTPPQQEGLVARSDVGKFGAVMGEPTVTVLGEKKGQNALPNMTVTTAMRIETGDADKATITFNDGTTLALNFNTTLEIPAQIASSKFQGLKPAIPNPQSEIRNPKSVDSKQERSATRSSIVNGKSSIQRPPKVILKEGLVLAKVVHGKTPEQFAVATRVATALDLGTEFSLELTHERVAKKSVDKAILKVKEGRVRFFNDFGSVDAAESTGSTAIAGAKPTEPKRVGVLRLVRLGPDFMQIISPRHAFNLPQISARLVLRLGNPEFSLATSAGMAHVVTDIVPDTPAAQSGLKVGDQIVEVEGKRAESDAQIYRAFFSRPDGAVRLTVLGRDGLKTLAIKAVKDDPNSVPSLGKGAAGRLRTATWPALEGDTGASVLRLQALVRSEPSGTAYNNLGVVLEIEGKMGEAIRAYGSAVRLDPGCAKFHSNLGLALSQIGNVPRAVDEFNATIALQPNWAFPRVNLVRLEIAEGHSEEALASMDRCISMFPREPACLVEKASTLRTMGRPAAAVPVLKRALAVDPDSASAWDNLALALMQMGQTAQALDAVHRAIGIDPLSPDSFNFLSLILRRSDPAAAERAIRRAIELAPSEANLHNTLGTLLDNIGKHKEAESEIRAAIALDPGFAEPHANLGIALVRIGQYAAAGAEFRESIRLDPDDAGGYLSLGAVYWNFEHRAKEAEELFKKGLTIAPNNANLLGNLAVVYGNEGDYEQAVAVLRRALALEPDNPTTLNNLAYNLAMSGKNLDEALAMARKAVKIAPIDFITETLGFVLFKHGDLDVAIAMIKKSIDMWTGPPVSLADSYVDLGAVYEKKGDAKSAIEQYRKALSLNPQQKQAQEAIKRLGG
ncbi:MAG: tetratricopeptide repeat protein, partial [Fimbriimonadales bacterium]